MRVEVHNRCSDFTSYRAARVKSLFNAETGCNFDLSADLPIEDDGWSLGLIVGPSGSGKTSLGREIFGPAAFWDPDDWPADKPIVDAIAQGGKFDDVTAALAGVGLGSVPSWLRPFGVLSNGEKFRANLARVICESPSRVVIDEFTSVVDRQIARVGALAFAKSWRRGAGAGGRQCVLLSCHYDIIDWLEPDWVFDIATGKYSGRGLWRRPKVELEVWSTSWRYWPLFEPHHYLKAPPMIAARCYVGAVEGRPVAHLGVSTKNKGLTVEARAARFVVMPEWQGMGLGLRFLNHVAQLQLEGKGRLPGRSLTTLINTSHPGLCRALRRDPRWEQISSTLYGSNKARSARSIAGRPAGPATGYGGHFRAIQGFRYYGE